MAHPKVPLSELAVAVQSAVEQALEKHGAVSVDKLWVGFVAPDAIANEQTAREITAKITERSGVKAQPSIAQLGAAGAGEAHKAELKLPGHIIIGLIFEKR